MSTENLDHGQWLNRKSIRFFSFHRSEFGCCTWSVFSYIMPVSTLKELQDEHQAKIRAANIRFFGDLQRQLWASLRSIFPECGQTSSACAFVDVIANNTPMLERFVLEWDKGLAETPANPVSYANAFSRLCGRPVTFYDTARCRDHKTLFSNPVLTNKFECDLTKMFEDNRFEVERKGLFEIIDTLNTLASSYAGRITRDIPTRKDIADDIENHKTVSGAVKSTPSAGKGNGAKGDAGMSASMLAEVIGFLREEECTEEQKTAVSAVVAELKTTNGLMDYQIQNLTAALSPIKAMEGGDPSAICSALLAIDHPLLNIQVLSDLAPSFTSPMSAATANSSATTGNQIQILSAQGRELWWGALLMVLTKVGVPYQNLDNIRAKGHPHRFD